MEATEMRPSTLQRKDRDELVQIAEALGLTPRSRSRKAEIVDMILEATTGSGLAKPDQTGEPDTDADTEPARNGSEQQSPAETSDNEGSEKSSSSDTSDPDTKEPEAKESAPKKSSASTKSASTDASDTDAKAEQSGEDGNEPGNRRRRRRGRDRDRDRDDAWDGDPVAVAGHLDLRDEGYGFLRVQGALASKLDAYVPVKMVRTLGLRRGDHLTGTSRPANRNEKNPAMLSVETVNGVAASEVGERALFEQLPAVFATEILALETPGDDDNVVGRVLDLVAPLGKGQRAVVAGPHRSGITTTLRHIAQSVETNDPSTQVMALLIDERPEEVTEMQRWLQRGDVIATTFDQSPEDHIGVAEMTVERAKRAAEAGADVVIVFDGLSRLARAYNQALSNAGRAYSGKVESGAVHMPKRFFGAGRNLEGAGSITIVASIQSGTGDSVDAVIEAELSHTANVEIRLDRWASELDIHPAIDVLSSVSRGEERMLDEDEIAAVGAVRAAVRDAAGDGPGAGVAALEHLLERIAATESNSALVDA